MRFIATLAVLGMSFFVAGFVPVGSAHAADSPLAIMLDHMAGQRAEHGLVDADFSDLRVSDVYQTADTGVTHIYLVQQVNGIDVLTSHANANILPDGDVLLAHVRFAAGVDRARFDGLPQLPATETAARVAAELGLVVRDSIQVLSQEFGPDSAQLLTDGGISEDPIPARLVYVETERDGLRLAWELLIDPIGRPNYWQIAADAETGKILVQYDWTVEHNQADIALDEPRPLVERHDHHGHSHEHHHHHVHAPIMPVSSIHGLETEGTSASYRVFGLPFESPTAPGAVHTLIENPAHPVASPFGWHDTTATSAPDFTITRGNNVHAYLDTNANNSPDPGSSPDGGANLVFDFAFNPALAPSGGTNPQASVVNLFYWNNVTHDLLHVHGFNEPAGNFQVNNYGRGGLGGDDVRAEGQDGAGINNANFFTPPDGNRPRMQMYNWNTTNPNRDGDFDAGIIAHEYGHGWSIRLTGGPSAVSCLNNQEQMGEGWSDFLSVVFTAQAGDTRSTNRGVGTYALGQPPTGNGIRPAPYNTDMSINNFTYANLPSMAVPHGVGFVWNTMLWDMYWNLVDEYGFNPNLYDDWTTGGNNLTLRLVSDGLKFQTCSPGFVDGRDAILAADVALTGGVNQCLIWDAFARRGLGLSASQGSPGNSNDGTAAFDLPQSCLGLDSATDSLNVCQGDEASFEISAGIAFNGPIQMSAVGNPAPSVFSFSPNPIDPGQSTTATVTNTAGVAAGVYSFEIVGDDGTTTDALGIELAVSSEAPESADPQLPADGSSNIGFSPTLSWTASAQGESFLVELATDAAFDTIIFSDVVSGNSIDLNGLESSTVYYWRVTASNACGAGEPSAVFSFSTEPLPGDCSIEEDTNVFLFEDFEASAPGWVSNGTGNTWQASTERVYAGEQSWHAVNSPTVSDQRMTSPAIALPEDMNSLSLNFWNYQILERRNASSCWDGGIVEISSDGGASWTQLTSTTHPYDGPIQSGFNNPLTGRQAWCGEPREWHRPTIALDDYAGETVQLRFRLGTDNTVGREGWYLDNVTVQGCTTAAGSFSIGGSVTGLVGSGLELQNNGSDSLVINANGTFTFGSELGQGDAYDVVVLNDPTEPNQSCEISNGSGSVGDGDITDIVVTCSFQGVEADAGGDQVVFVGALVTLDGSGSQDFDGNPLNYTWTETGGAGIVIDNPSSMVASFAAPSEPASIEIRLDVDNSHGESDSDIVLITVEDIAVTGLSASNDGPTVVNDPTLLSATVDAGTNVSYSWDFGDGNGDSGASVSHGYSAPGTYTATVTASNGAGSVQAQTEVTVIGLYTIGGTASGVTAPGLVLSINGGEQLAIESDGPFSFADPLLDGDTYTVTISSQIDDEQRVCRVINGSGLLAGADIDDVQVICSGNEIFDDRFESGPR